MSSAELWRLSAVAIAEGVRRRDFSCREVVEDAIAHCETVNPQLNAIVDFMPEEALAQAGEADAAVARNEVLGPLHGVPVTYKINVDYAGRPTTDGVRTFRDRLAEEDSSPVRNWKAAGAICLGRTNVPAFSARYFTDNALHGATLNPWCADRTPGGSSGGAAAAVAAGIGALAHGNDRAGSVRYPAYACGVYGLRPTLGRVPGYTATIGDRTLISQLTNVQGPLARSIADLSLAFRALAMPDPRDVWFAPVPFDEDCGPVRVALFSTANEGAELAPEVAQALQTAAYALRQGGFQVEEASPPGFEEAAAQFFALIKTEEVESASRLIDELGDEALKRARASTMASVEAFDFRSYVQAGQRRAILLREWQRFTQRYPLILMPVSRQLPFPVGTDGMGEDAVAAMLRAQAPLLAVSTLGLPGLAVPIGLSPESIPVGVQLVAGRFGEELCLHAGKVIEAHCPMPMPPPIA